MNLLRVVAREQRAARGPTARGVVELGEAQTVAGEGVNTVSAQGTPLVPALPDPAQSPWRQIAGTVTVTGAPEVYASVRALQPLDTKVIEVAALPTTTSGTYAFALPTAAPGRATWSQGTTNYSFTGYTSAAGLYRVEASADGYLLPQTLPAPPTPPYDLKAGNIANVNFTFPAP